MNDKTSTGTGKLAKWFLLLFLIAMPSLSLGAEDQVALDRQQLMEILKNAKSPPTPHIADYSRAESAALNQQGVVEMNVTSGEETVIDRPEPANGTVEPPLVNPQPGLMPQGVDGVQIPEIPGILENGSSLERDGDDLSGTLAGTPPTTIVNTLSTPWKTVFKLLMRFNVSGTDFYYVCSASSLGSFHLLTAGHCIYNHDPNDDGNTSDAKWADEVWAWAAQTDRVNPIGDGDFPFGVAKAVLLRSYTGWTQSSNFNHDWGVITLDRRRGDQTGWMGRESGVTASSLNFTGYPTETPYVPAGTLFQYYGFDANNVSSYTTYRINLDAFTYGGHSGGPAWRYDGTSRWIQGLNSTSNRVGFAGETRLTSGKMSDITSFMSTDESTLAPIARPDLVEYVWSLTAKDLLTNVADQGDPIQVEYNLLNAGFANTGTITVDFYLSTNDFISTFDRKIGTRTLSGVNGFTFLNPITTLTVPSDMNPGTYYVGWIMSSAVTEYNTDDNTVVIANETLTVNQAVTPTVAFNTTTSSGPESVSPASPGVSLSTTSASTVTVNFSVTGGSASGGGVDYTLANGTLTFNPGNTTPVAPISASIVNDLLDESNETIILTLSNPSNATLGTNVIHTYTIQDNDPLPTVAFDSVSSSGDESISPANFSVSLSEVSGRTVTVDYSVTGTAIGGGVDYTLANGTLTFNPGSTTPVTPISASIVNDGVDEFNETIIVTLSNPADATLGTNTAHTYTIVDDDPLSNTIDFNADGWSDLLFEETGDGTVKVALLANSVITSSADLFQIPPGEPWMVVGTGDLNADENSDILIFNDVTGDIVMGLLDGTTVLSGATVVSLGPASPFVPKGMGDFDADGDAEIVLYDSTTGDLFLLFLSGSVAVSLDFVAQIDTANDWRLENVGHFNRDGKTDFMIYNTVTGDVSVMEMDGITVLATTKITMLDPVPGWTPKDTGDFDGDGDSDIVAVNTAGDTRITLFEGLVETGTYNLSPMSANDLFISAGNFSADKIADLLVLDTLSGDLNSIIQDGTAQTGVNTIINLGPSPAGINFLSGKRFNQP